MAKKTLADAKAEIEELKRRLALAESGEAEPQAVGAEYPKAKYRTAKVTDQRPHGYEVRRVSSAEEEAELSPEWKNSPVELGIGQAGRNRRPPPQAPAAGTGGGAGL